MGSLTQSDSLQRLAFHLDNQGIALVLFRERARFLDGVADGTYTVPWQHQSSLEPAHAGTLSFSSTKGVTAKVTVEGRWVLWFDKHGPHCGKAAVTARVA